MKADEKSQKPREMVHRAQAQCARWLHQLRRARQNQPDAPAESRARGEFHAAVMLYWEQVKRFSHRDHISDEWHEQPVVEIDGEERPLDYLSEKRLSTIARRTQQPDPETMGVDEEIKQQAWQLQPTQALAVYDALDRMANELGFDAEPVQQRNIVQPVTGEEAEDTADSKFAAQPVEVPE